MNTNFLASELDVSPKTVRRWIHFFDSHFAKSTQGHYTFTEQDLIFFRHVKEEIKKGRLLKEIKQDLELKTNRNKGEINVEEIEDKIGKIFKQLKFLENKINGKADEVVSYQILLHRKEIEELQAKVLDLEQKLLSNQPENTMRIDNNSNQNNEKKKRKGLIRAVLG